MVDTAYDKDIKAIIDAVNEIQRRQLALNLAHKAYRKGYKAGERDGISRRQDRQHQMGQ